MVNNNINIGPKTYQNSKVIIVDPNPEDNKIVTPENLNIIVSLKTTDRSRSSILIDSSSSNVTTTVNSGNKGRVINFIGGSKIADDKSLTTHYTELNTKFNEKENDLETLGITNIKIEFNTSYAPMVTIDFVDVRGKLFEMGNDSPFNIFFKLPYPIFELTIKGYYGKAVTYCLHLTKFSGRLNDKTGNYEMTTEFVGYTYAFLTDMLIGYLRAIPYTSSGKTIIEEKNRTSISTPSGEVFNGFLTIDELKDGVDNINLDLLKIKNDDSKVAALALAENTLVSISTFKDELKIELDKVISNNLLRRSGDGAIIITSKPNDVSKIKELETKYNETIGNKIKNINTFLSDNYRINENAFKIINNTNKFINVKSSDFESNDFVEYQTLMSRPENEYRQIPKLMANTSEAKESYELISNVIKFINNKNGEYVIYDMTDSYKELNDKNDKIKRESIEAKKNVATTFSDQIAQSLGKIDENGNPISKFEPTIINFFKIISDHIDVFIKVMKDLAKEIHV